MINAKLEAGNFKYLMKITAEFIGGAKKTLETTQDVYEISSTFNIAKDYYDKAKISYNALSQPDQNSNKENLAKMDGELNKLHEEMLER
jgi:hypothetical protein